MNPNGTERRIAELESRLARIERRLGLETEPAPVPPPSPARATAPSPPLAPPPPRAVEYLPRVTKPPAPPRTALEQTIGLKWAGWVGAIVLVIGAALGIKFAYDQGWLGGIPPAARLVLMSLGGFALMGVGEVVYRRVGRVASAGLFGAGVATLFLVSFAGYAYYELYARDTAFTLMALSTLVGALLAMRGRLVSVAAIALVGGNVAPLVIKGDSQLVVPLLAYLLALQAVALFLAWWGASPKWWILRTLSLVTTTLWTAQLMLAAPAAAHGWSAPFGFALVFCALYQLELILSAVGALGGGQHISVRRMTGFSLIVTALLCAAGLYVWRDASDLTRGAWVISLAAACAGIGFVLPRLGKSLHDFAIGYRVQAAGLLVVAVPVALSGSWIVIGWGALGLGFAILGAALDLSVSRRAGAAVWFLGIVYLIAWSNFIGSRESHESWLNILSHPIPAYAVLAAFMTVIGHAIAVLMRIGSESIPQIERSSMILSAIAGLVLVIASIAALPTLGATFTIIIYAWLLTLADMLVPRAKLAAHAAAAVTLATVKWVVIDTLADRLAPGWRPMLYRPLLNPIMGIGMLLAGSMAGIAWLRRSELKKLIGTRTSDIAFIGALAGSMMVILIIGLSMEIDRVIERAAASAVAMAFPVAQMKHLGWTMLWTTGAAAGLGIHRLLTHQSDRRPPAPMWLIGIPLLLAAKFLLLDTLVFRFDHPVARAMVLFNLQMLAAIFVVGSLLLAWHFWRERDEPSHPLTALFGFGVVLVLLWAGSLEIDRAAGWLTRTGTLAARESVVRQVGLSIFWSIYAIACVALGFRARSAALRYFGLGLFAVTLLKVVLVDLSQVATGYRVLSFMGLGLLLLGTSVLYGKLSPRLLRTA